MQYIIGQQVAPLAMTFQTALTQSGKTEWDSHSHRTLKNITHCIYYLLVVNSYHSTKFTLAYLGYVLLIYFMHALLYDVVFPAADKLKLGWSTDFIQNRIAIKKIMN